MNNSPIPSISILIPVYNVETYISRCLKSIQMQTFTNYEVIIVDDGSRDNSIKIAEEFVQKDHRFKIIRKNENEGLMMARRTGYLNAKGKYIFFCDSDDYLLPQALEVLHTTAEMTDTEIVVGNVIMEYETGGRRHINRARKAKNIDQFKKAILIDSLSTIWGILYRRNLFSKNQYETFMHQNFSEDRILLYQVLQKAKSITSIDKEVYIYYINNKSMTQQGLSKERLEEQMFAINWCYDWIKKNEDLDELNNRWLIRTLSYYIESNYKIDNYLSASPFQNLISFSSINKYCGLRFALHTKLCQTSNYYRKFSSYGRKLIRKIRNKLN